MIIRNPGSRQHQDALKDAALFPSLFREIYDTRLNASDDSLTHYLIMDQNFTPDGANRFVKSFRETLVTAKLTGDGTLLELDDDIDDFEEDDSPPETAPQHVANPASPPCLKGLFRYLSRLAPIESLRSSCQSR